MVMKMYISSKRQRLLHLIGLFVHILSLSLTSFYIIRAVQNDERILIVSWVMCSFIACFGIIAIIRIFLDDPVLGRYSFDSYAVTFYTPLNTFIFPYTECKEIGFTRWVGASAASNQQYMYYIFLSKKELTEEQRRLLFEVRSKRKCMRMKRPVYQSDYLLFQYSPSVFLEFIKCVPEPFRGKLIEEEKQLNLTPREKRLNR